MLSCMVTCRSQDKKPDGNKLNMPKIEVPMTESYKNMLDLSPVSRESLPLAVGDDSMDRVYKILNCSDIESIGSLDPIGKGK